VRLAIVLSDGMADRPEDFADGKTPLEIADTPEMDRLAREGECGTVSTVPASLVPGSDVAILAVLGLDPREHRVGRASIEAAGRDVEVRADEVVFRMNLVTVADGVLRDYSAGGITTDAAAPLVDAVRDAVAHLGARVSAGVGYRHLMCVKDADGRLERTVCHPPHDVLGRSVDEIMPAGDGAEALRAIMSAANRAIAGMAQAANSIWLWGQGRAAALPSLRERYGSRGAVIGAVDLVRGLGRAMGMDVIEVDGANGDVDTNFAGKGEAAARALDEYDVVFVHVEAPDEASHRGDRAQKIKAIESVDREVLSRVRRAAERRADTRVLVMPDHLTPLAIRTHAHGAVPYALWGPGIAPSGVQRFCERTAQDTGVNIAGGWEILGRSLDDEGTE
jgi:2,3-bisphosphoglycerate-independent phosphoglycerate mutase